MGTLVFFLCYKAVLFYCDGIRLGIRNLIAEESLIIPRLQRYLPFGDVLYFFTCFDGIVKSIGEQGTETYIIDSQQSVNGNIEKAVYFFIQCGTVFTVQHSVNNTVFTENTVIHCQLS